MHPFAQSALGGIMIGLASWLLLASLGRVAGISGIAAGALVPIKDDTAWRWIFLVCLVLGGAVTAYWVNPPATLLRPTGLLLASGLLVGFGTVLGSDCTSGHGVCGMGRQPGLCDGRRIVRFTVDIFCDAPRWAKTLSGRCLLPAQAKRHRYKTCHRVSAFRRGLSSSELLPRASVCVAPDGWARRHYFHRCARFWTVGSSKA